MDKYLLERQVMFSKNIECCREVIFDLRYVDITAYTGLAESTMISYDTKSVSPYITVAKKIADMYCTDIERLCGDEIYFDIEEVLSYTKSDKKMENNQIKFVLLKKIGKAVVDYTVTDDEIREALKEILYIEDFE